MSIHQFIWQYSIKPADAIIMKKKFFGMVNHFVIYLGKRGNSHVFIANYTEGVKIIPQGQIQKFLEYLVPRDIDRFRGNISQRRAAIKRANSRIGERAYNMWKNNCEHFKNWVQYGNHESEQVENVKAGLTMAAGGLALVGIIAAIVNSDD